MGSWKIMEIWQPRILRISLRAEASRSSPRTGFSRRRSAPEGSGTSRMMERAVTLLPQPDSPTTPRVSPPRISKSTPSTALTTPSSVSK